MRPSTSVLSTATNTFVSSAIVLTTVLSGCSQDWEDGHHDAGDGMVQAPPLNAPNDGSLDAQLDADPSPTDGAPSDAGQLDASLPDASLPDATIPTDERGIPFATCEPGRCLNGATCSATTGTAVCTCPSGTQGERCEDIDECVAANVCNPRFPCRNFAGGYTCVGQFADWHVTTRSSAGGTAADQQLIIDTTANTVLDRITGLMWDRSFSTGSFTSYADARANCVASRKGGFSDWRLPSFAESSSLFATDRVPDHKLWAIDETKIPGRVWNNQGAVGRALQLELNSPYGYDMPQETDPLHPAFMHCVRTAELKSKGTPTQRYVATADTVYDTATELTWERNINLAEQTWSQASTYCQQLGRGFRLPTLAEAFTVFDYGTGSTASVFEGGDLNTSIWTVTPYARNPATRLFAGSLVPSWSWGNDDGSTADAGALNATRPAHLRVRCVRTGKL